MKLNWISSVFCQIHEERFFKLRNIIGLLLYTVVNIISGPVFYMVTAGLGWSMAFCYDIEKCASSWDLIKDGPVNRERSSVIDFQLAPILPLSFPLQINFPILFFYFYFQNFINTIDWEPFHPFLSNLRRSHLKAECWLNNFSVRFSMLERYIKYMKFSYMQLHICSHLQPTDTLNVTKFNLILVISCTLTFKLKAPRDIKILK